MTEFARAEIPGVPKHVRLRNAVMSAIRKGFLRPGDQLPPEQELSRAVGLSLGTVQRALTRLASDQALIREQGRGTFITKSELAEEDLWQFRFVDKVGEAPLPVSTELVSRRHIKLRGMWSEALEWDEKGYCEFTRNITIDGHRRCLSRLYARITRFPKIMKLSESKFRGNLKTVFAEEFDAPTLTLDQYVEPSKFDSEICALLGLPSGSVGVALHATGRSVGQEIITFQSLWMPAGAGLLEIAASRNRLASS